ncbi:MAG: FAD-dependent oxidoreductase [Acidobacteriota bacterium]|jgi:glycine/D-amino acid oxidase-like deaminating enzyme
MKTTRRRFLKTVGAAAVGTGLASKGVLGEAPAIRTTQGGTKGGTRTHDVAVVGAGVFGSWIAYELRRAGRSVALIDAYGPGNARSSSGGQTRVIRMGYGDQEIYSRWSMRSLERWKELSRRSGRPGFFQESGVLWMARERDPLTVATAETLERLKVPHERLERPELEKRWPQIDFGPITWAIHEPESGFLAAFHGVQAVARRALGLGAEFLAGRVAPPTPSPGRSDHRLAALTTDRGETVHAGAFVFACGPWLGRLFPGILGDRLFTSRQEVFHLGPPPGDERFGVGAIPVWADFAEEIYGLPDFKGRGFKVAVDAHGPPVDPDTVERIVTPATSRRVTEYAGRRFPALAGSPIVGGAVCQYTNTSNGDFLIDRHPELENVWLVGGGSGHGFKHGPAIGEYVAARIEDGGPVDRRFSLATKGTVQRRDVY